MIHGLFPGAGDPARGGKAAIITAGRQEVERGLDRMEGKPTTSPSNTSATGQAPDRDREHCGVGDGTGAAPNTAPHASTATPRDDPTTQNARGAAADTGHPVDTWGAAATTATHHDRPIAAAANGPPGLQRDTDLRQQGIGNATVGGGQDKLDRETVAMASESPRDRPTAATDGPGAQRDRDTDVRQQVQGQGNGPATGTGITSDRDKQIRADDSGSSDPQAVNAATGTAGYDRPAASCTRSPGVHVVRQQGNGFTSGDRDKAQESRTTVDTSDPVSTAAGQERHYAGPYAPQA